MGKHLKIRTVVLGFMLICVCGCGRSREAAVGPTVIKEPVYQWGNVSGRTISVWGREADLSRSYITRAFDRYEELTGNTVNVVPYSPDQIEQAVIDELGRSDSELDLLLYFGGANLDAFHPDVNFYDFSEAQWVDDLTDVSINQAIYHVKVIGLPHWEASVSGTLYNKKLFHKLGITPPRTQEEFQEACRILKQNGITPLYLPCASPTMLLYQFPMDAAVDERGVMEALNDGNTGYQDIGEMYRIVKWYRAMAQNGYLGDNYLENSWDGMSAALESGEYAMMLCWDTWLYTDFEGNSSDFGLMPAFVGVPDQGTFEGPNLSLLLVNKNSAQVDASLDLISFMADPYNYNAAFEGIYTAPVFRQQMASISTPQYVEAAGWIEENYTNSIAWLNIKGFSQSDAACILKYMVSEDGYTARQCLTDMEMLRQQRISSYTEASAKKE